MTEPRRTDETRSQVVFAHFAASRAIFSSDLTNASKGCRYRLRQAWNQRRGPLDCLLSNTVANGNSRQKRAGASNDNHGNASI